MIVIATGSNFDLHELSRYPLPQLIGVVQDSIPPLMAGRNVPAPATHRQRKITVLSISHQNYGSVAFGVGRVLPGYTRVTSEK